MVNIFEYIYKKINEEAQIHKGIKIPLTEENLANLVSGDQVKLAIELFELPSGEIVTQVGNKDYIKGLTRAGSILTWDGDSWDRWDKKLDINWLDKDFGIFRRE